MKVHQFLDAHGITENPFAQEDAQTDTVFRDHCMKDVHHPAWDKIMGKPNTPETSVVFGKRGSGKTAIKLQLVDAIEKYNKENPDKKTWFIEYDDFNPFLDNFRERLSGRQRKQERAIKNWRLADHLDAVLSLGVTQLVDQITDERNGHSEETVSLETIREIPHIEKRDLLLLTALYDRSFNSPRTRRWSLLRSKLRYSNWTRFWPIVVGVAVTALTVTLIRLFAAEEWQSYLLNRWTAGVILLGWLPLAGIQLSLFWKAWRVSRQVRVVESGTNLLRKLFGKFVKSDLSGQPLPMRNRTDDRYELLMKFQAILRSLKYSQVMVVVDRVDEPHLVDGQAERMRDLMWPLFDNKVLKHTGVGFKLLLPEEIFPLLQRHEKKFYDRSRLDKQNLIPSLSWTGESLYDLANNRIQACAKLAETPPKLTAFFDGDMSRDELVNIFAQLKVPRLMFKFFYRLLVDHCSKHTDDAPKSTINRETLQSTLALFKRDIEDFERGVGTV